MFIFRNWVLALKSQKHVPGPSLSVWHRRKPEGPVMELASKKGGTGEKCHVDQRKRSFDPSFFLRKQRKSEGKHFPPVNYLIFNCVNNIVLVSASQLCEPAMIIYIMYVLSLSSLPPAPRPTSLGRHRAPGCTPCVNIRSPLAVLPAVAYACQCNFLYLFPPPSPAVSTSSFTISVSPFQKEIL